jgi:N-acetylneuraminate synthase
MAEVGMAHDGSLGMAHAYVDAVAKAGADAIKFQCHLAEAESTPDEPWRVEPEWPQDASRFDYWKRTAFTRDQWWSLKAHANEKRLAFLCSPFSVEAVKMLDRMVEAWKVPSGELANRELLWALQKTDKPVIMSTGMATSLEPVMTAGMGHPFEFHPHAFLQCTSQYPTPPERVGLNLVQEWQRWNVPIGLSDHSGTIYPGLAAVALGCDILEVHVCFSKQQFGFDVSSSITVEQLAQLVEGVRFIEAAKAPVDKDEMAKELEPMRELFMKKHKRKEAMA